MDRTYEKIEIVGSFEESMSRSSIDTPTVWSKFSTLSPRLLPIHGGAAWNVWRKSPLTSANERHNSCAREVG
jgi:hypothetical protein